MKSNADAALRACAARGAMVPTGNVVVDYRLSTSSRS